MANLGDDGLSGHSVRGAVDNASTPDGTLRSLEDAVQDAADFVYKALDLVGESMQKAVDVASDKAFQSAADVGVNIATPASQQLGASTFSWGGYIQALGILCLLLGGLWFAVWAIRKYGKFNFLPRPGSLPKDALVMEAQMPLGPKKGLMVVRFLNRRLLLGVTDHQISLLTEDNSRDNRQKQDFKAYMEDIDSSGADSGSESSS